MKIKQFLNDAIPMGKGAIKIPINGVVDQYRERYNKLSKKSNVKFTHKVYTVLPNRTIIHVKVPSETVDNFYYDVLLELDKSPTAKSLADCDAKFFSNCPSFIFGYAYVFLHYNGVDPKALKGKRKSYPSDNLIIKGLESKLGELAISEPPDVRNPNKLPIPDKSIYFALFYLDSLPWVTLLINKININPIQLDNRVLSFDALMNERKKTANANKRKSSTKYKAEMDSIATTEKVTKKTNRIVKPTTAIQPKKPKSASRSKSVKKIGG